MFQIVASLTDNSIGIIYDHSMFIVQATSYILSDMSLLDPELDS